MITVDVAEVITGLNAYDAMWMQHGVYASWGSFLEYFKKKGIRNHIVDISGYHENKIAFNDFVEHDYYDKYLAIRKNKVLAAHEEKELDDFLRNRIY